MLKIASMGFAGLLLIFASGLILNKNGVSHAAVHIPRHTHAKIITTMLLQEQGHLPSPGMIPKKGAESKVPNILVEESKEPPLLQKEEIQPVQFQPMKEEPTLPLFPPAPALTPALIPVPALIPMPALIPVLEEIKTPVVEEKKAAPATLPIQIHDDVKTPAPALAPVPSQTIDLPRVLEGIYSGIKSSNIKFDEPKNGTITLGFFIGNAKPPFIKFEGKGQVKTNISMTEATKDAKAEISKLYLVRFDSENFQEIAKKTLGNEKRWPEIAKLNPALIPEAPLEKGVVVKVPADATLQSEEPASTVQPLPEARPKLPDAKSKIIVTLTGTYPRALEGKRILTLPPEVIDQLGNCTQVLMSPGPDPCLWLTSVDHLEKLSDRLEHSPASEKDVRVFRRLFFGQIEKIPVQEGKIVIPERLALFGSLEKEIAIVGVEDHFEIWDLERWRKYTQKMSSLEKK
jgi:MraZ protein